MFSVEQSTGTMVPLYYRTGYKKDQKLEQKVAEYLEHNTDFFLIWVDPFPGKNQSKDKWVPVDQYQQLLTVFDPVHPIAEARVFMKQSMLHVIANENGGCRWFECSEVPFLQINDADETKTGEFEKSPKEIYLLQDKKRFGIETQIIREKVKIVEYRYTNSGKAFTWRIDPLSVVGGI